MLMKPIDNVPMYNIENPINQSVMLGLNWLYLLELQRNEYKRL